VTSTDTAPIADPDEILDLKDVARITGYTVRTVKSWLDPSVAPRSGRQSGPTLKTWKVGEGQTAKRLTYRRDLDAFLAACRGESPARRTRRAR
jgi:hypothetical protein